MPPYQYNPWDEDEELRKAGLLPPLEEAVAPAGEGFERLRAPTPEPYPWLVTKQDGDKETRTWDTTGRATKTELGGGRFTVRSPEGETQGTRAPASSLETWITRKKGEQDTAEALRMRRATRAGEQQAQDEMEQRAQQDQFRRALRGVLETHGPVAYLQVLAELSKAQQVGRQGALTPEQILARTLAEMAGRYGDEARKLRGETAFVVNKQGELGKATGATTPLAPGGLPAAGAIKHAEAQGAPVPAGERQDISQMDSVVGIANRLAAGIDKLDEISGPVRGRYGAIMESLGGTFGIPEAEPFELALRADINDMNNRLVYMLSGKQINETEFQRLRKTMPDPNLPPATNRVRIQRFRAELQAIRDKRMELQTTPAGNLMPSTPQGGQPASGGWRIVR